MSKTVNELPLSALPLLETDFVTISRNGIVLTSATIADLNDTHEIKLDPHPQYLRKIGGTIAGDLLVTGSSTVNSNLFVLGDITVEGADILTSSPTFNLLNTPVTINAFQNASNVSLGHTTGTTTIRNNVSILGSVSITGNSLNTLSSSFSLLNTPTSVNALQSATTISIGADTGITTVRNNLTINGNLTVSGLVNAELSTNNTPVLFVGGNGPLTTNNGKDRGIQFRFHDGVSERIGFFGFDQSTDSFTFIKNANNVDFNYSGTPHDFTARNFIGALVGNASTASRLLTPRSITLSGDISGTGEFDGSNNLNIVTTIQPNTVILGADTIGNYISTGTVSGLGISGIANGEGSQFNISLNSSSSNVPETLVYRNSLGDFSGRNITADKFLGILDGRVLVNVSGGNNTEVVRVNMADTDHFRINVGGAATTLGFAEIATSGSGNEPIFVRQYINNYSQIVRTLTLLNEQGNTFLPGSLEVIGNIVSDGDLTTTGRLWTPKDSMFNGITIGKGFNNLNGNTAVGFEVLQNNTTGNNNTAIGYRVLQQQTSGSNNTGLGFSVLNRISSGTNNTAVGNLAGSNATTAINNVLVGSFAAPNLSDGDNNVIVGYQSASNLTSGDRNIAIGTAALNTVSNGMSNVSVGYQAGYSITTGSNNIAIGENALFNCTTGTNNFAIGNNSGTDAVFNINGSLSNIGVIGNNLTSAIYAKVGLTTTSDIRDKTEIHNLDIGLDFINKITPISFKFKENRNSNVATGRKYYGFSAQDIAYHDDVIVDSSDKDNLKLNKDDMIAVLVKAVQELSKEIEVLKKRIK